MYIVVSYCCKRASVFLLTTEYNHILTRFWLLISSIRYIKNSRDKSIVCCKTEDYGCRLNDQTSPRRISWFCVCCTLAKKNTLLVRSLHVGYTCVLRTQYSTGFFIFILLPVEKRKLSSFLAYLKLYIFFYQKSSEETCLHCWPFKS